MAVYLLVSADFVLTGGQDRANYALASYLLRRGDEVHLVAHRVAPELLKYPNILFHRVRKPANSYLLGELLIDRAGRYWASKIQASGGRVVVNGGNCQWGDANWVHYVHAAYTPQSALSPLRKLKVAWSHRVFLAHERNALRRARMVIANSHRTKLDLVERVGIPAERIHVVYYGTDPACFTIASDAERAAAKVELGWAKDRPVVAFIGALGDRRKGFDTLFAAWSKLCACSDWDADLAIIGTGAELPAWRARAEAAGFARRFHFLGFRRDVPRVLNGCDALASPTRYEAYGLGVHEALCCGLPAIVSSSAGVSEQLDGKKFGWRLDDPGDADALAACLRSWWRNRDAARAVAIEIAARLRARMWDDMAVDILQQIDADSAAGARSAPHVRAFSQTGLHI